MSRDIDGVSPLFAHRVFAEFGYEREYHNFLNSPQNYTKLLRECYTPVAFNPSYAGHLAKFNCVSRGSSICGNCTTPVSSVSFSAMDLQLWRAPVLRQRSIKALKHLGPKWSKALSTYIRMLPKEAAHLCIFVLAAHSGEVSSLCEACFIEHLKAISIVALGLNISDGPGWWSYLSDIHIVGGYDTVLNRKDVLADYATESQRLRGCDTPELRAEIQRCVKLFSGRSVHNQVSFEQFVEFRDSWALQGASTVGSPAVISIRGAKKKKRIRGKFASLLATSDEEIVSRCFERRNAEIFPFRKLDEPVKTRVVQSYDFYSYMRCSYADSFLSDYNGYGKWTTAGMGLKDRAAVRLELLSALKAKNAYAISTDQSAFDESQRKSIVRFTMASIWDRVIDLARADLKDKLKELRDVDLYSFDHAIVNRRVRGGNAELICQWDQGVPSGHKWTALIDSLINRAESLSVLRSLNLKLKAGYWQGDDGVMIVSGPPVTSTQLADRYALMGLTVNSAKTWVSDTRFEFLHEVHGPEQAWGFPVRAAKSLLWRKPGLGGSGFVGIRQQTTEEFDTLLKCARRGLQVMPLVERAVLSVVSPRVRRDAVLDFVRTPLALGGLGFGYSGRTCGEWTDPEIHYSKIHIDSPVRMTGPTPSFTTEAALRRLGLSAPLPAKPSMLKLIKVQVPKLEPMGYFANGRLPKTNWTLPDYNVAGGPNPWCSKLALEHYLEQRETIPIDLVPSDIIKTAVMGHDRALRLINKWSGHTVTLANAATSAEPFFYWSDWANRMWAGILSHTAVYFPSGSRLNSEAVKIAYAAFFRAHVVLTGLRVAV